MPRMPCSGRRRGAFTLVELLVVISIIAVLIALLMPAAQKVREAAHRARCANNLKQLGLAIHHYHSACGALPAGIGPWAEGPRPLPRRDGRGWILVLLPYLEQDNLYRRFEPYFGEDFMAGGGIRNPGCREALQTPLPVLQCPTDPSVQGLSSNQYQLVGTPVALTSYKGVIGDTRMGGANSIHPGSMPDTHGTVGCNGLFYRNAYQEPLRFALITDGTANTLMVGEDVSRHNHHSAAYYANGDYASCHAPLNYKPDPPTPDYWPNVISFRSLHPGGAHFCLADGSVRFISDGIDHGLYRALSTKAGREVVTPP